MTITETAARLRELPKELRITIERQYAVSADADAYFNILGDKGHADQLWYVSIYVPLLYRAADSNGSFSVLGGIGLIATCEDEDLEAAMRCALDEYEQRLAEYASHGIAFDKLVSDVNKAVELMQRGLPGMPLPESSQ